MSELFKLSEAFPISARMPVLFLGHGNPMNAIEENQFVEGFRIVAQTLPKPNAILCISAHWYTKGTKVTAMSHPKTIHDFMGFPKVLSDVQYPAPGSPILASETQKILHASNVDLDHEWGLDHGTWSVVKHLYPMADVPIVQLSIDYSKSSTSHFNLAQQLSILRDRGILIIGSGNIIHNLRLVDFANINNENYGYDWAHKVQKSVNDFIVDENFQALVNYEKQSEAYRLAIPTPDHYLPLIYTLALKQKGDDITLFNDKLVGGSLSMTSIKIGH